jgi:hypothetical protein
MLKIIEGLPPDVDGDRSYGQGNALRILPEVESVSGPPMVAHRGRARGRRLSDLAVWNNRSVAASVANPRRPPVDFDDLTLVASVNGYPITSTERVFDV